MTTINELYAREPIEVTKSLDYLKGCYYDHIPEVRFNYWETDPANANERVTIRFLKNWTYDGRRVWILASVWLDDRPVMLIQNAGREGDDHVKRFITDAQAYAEMVQYISSILTVDVGDHRSPYDPDEERDDLNNFYGDSLDSVPEAGYNLGTY